jgi:hypothetical protein
MSNDQLKVYTEALDTFTSQLRALIQDGSATLFPASFHGGLGNSDVESVVSDMANNDLLIGQRLNSYLTALADLTAASAKATRDLDQKLSTEATAPAHTRWKELY